MARMTTTPGPRPRGQSFLELAIMTPVLLLLLASMVEVTFTFNDYLQMLDAARNGARDSSDLNPIPKDPSAFDGDTSCTTTRNFIRRTACNAEYGLLPLTLSPGGQPRNCSDPDLFQDDIVISIFTTAKLGAALEVKRYDATDYNGGDPRLGVPGSGAEDTDESGWSFMQDQTGSGGMCSQLSKTDLTAQLISDAPNTAFILVEVFFRHYQLFDLPGFGDVIPNPIRLHSYAVFPLSAAEPTPTPKP